MDKTTIGDLAEKLAASLPEGMRAVKTDLENNFKVVLEAGLKDIDLVTREEFAVQEAVLARTREKLERLEARLAEIEQQDL